MLVTIEAMRQHGLTVDEVDALTGPAMGRPKTATFRMLDLIGLDTLLHVVDNVRERSEDAAEQRLLQGRRSLSCWWPASGSARRAGRAFIAK